jgi:hypothetical protein
MSRMVLSAVVAGAGAVAGYAYYYYFGCDSG